MVRVGDTQKGKIYKIISFQCDECYIGSTTRPLRDRLRAHRNHRKQWLKGTFARLTSFVML